MQPAGATSKGRSKLERTRRGRPQLMRGPLDGGTCVTDQGRADLTFEDLRRTPDGRLLYKAQSWLNRRVLVIALIWGPAFLLLSIILIRWLRTGVEGGRWLAMGYLASMALLLLGSIAFAQRVAVKRPGARCPQCDASLIGQQLRTALELGHCGSCGRALPGAAV